MPPAITRRRFICITAAAAGLTLLPFAGASQAAAEAVTWHGRALGAPASLRIHHHDRGQAERLVESVAAEVRRLERIFSLYLHDSELSVLNRQGLRATPSPELIEVLSSCDSFWRATAGAFDPTVQPLWALFAHHFSTPGADPAGPDAAALQRTLASVGFDAVRFSAARIKFERPRMALTLNGIAQGYVTDQIVRLLRTGGITSCLVDMGESHALGRTADGAPWQVGIGDPLRPGALLDVLQVVDRAVATSSAHGFQFDGEGRFNHLIDPRSGRSARRYESVTVIAPEATAADALSTAFSLMDDQSIAHVVAALTEVEVYLFPRIGKPVQLRSRSVSDTL